jgi:WD40 repeat protein
MDGPLIGHTEYVLGVLFSPDSLRLISVSTNGTIRIWSARGKWQKTSQQITAVHLSQQPESPSNGRISLKGHPSVISACCSPDGSLYAASTLEGRISIWNMDHKLIWETNTSIHPIHLLRFSETQLVLSTPDGSAVSWNLLNGKPMDEEASAREPQLDSSNLQSTRLPIDTVSWFPFDFDAGLWAYVDKCLIRFEDEGSITVIDLLDFSQ